jgi:Dienelactone hydrolase family
LGDCISLSGGDDDAHGNQTELEAALNAGNAIWEITRYSGVVHGFTKWDAADAYSLKADARSWESMMTTFEQLLPLPVRLLDEGDGGDVEAPAPLDNNSDSPSSVPNQSPGALDGPTISPLQSGAPSSIPTITSNATFPEQPTAVPTIVVSTSSGRHSAVYHQHLHIATAILSLCFLWTILP